MDSRSLCVVQEEFRLQTNLSIIANRYSYKDDVEIGHAEVTYLHS